jgi:hypothetical protein
MKKNYTMIVKSITHTTVENEDGESDSDKLTLKNEEKGVSANITAEAGAWEGLMIGERVEIQVFNPQMTIADAVAKPKIKKEDDIMQIAKKNIKEKKKERVEA